MQEATRPPVEPERSTLWNRILSSLLLGGPRPVDHRERMYSSRTPQQAKAIARRRAANKVARRSRQINRQRAGR